MLYRIRFDGIVSAILKRSGYDTSDSLAFWPVGATGEWVRRGGEKGWKPIECAVIAVAELASQRLEHGQMSFAEVQHLASTAYEIGLRKGARTPVLERVLTIAYKAPTRTAETNDGPTPRPSDESKRPSDEAECRVHVSDVMSGERTEQWVIGRDVSKDVYGRFKDDRGELFAAIHYEAGEPVTNVMTKAKWNQLKAQGIL